MAKSLKSVLKGIKFVDVVVVVVFVAVMMCLMKKMDVVEGLLNSPPTPTSDEDSSPCGYLNTDNTCSQQPNCEWYRDNCRQRYPRLGVNWCLDHNLDLGDFGGQEGCHIDDDCSQENIDMFRRDGSNSPQTYREGEICAGTWEHRRDGDLRSCMNITANRDDCAGTAGCTVAQC